MLELEGKRITDDYIHKRVDLTDEIELALYWTRVTDAGLRTIAERAPNLSSFYSYKNKITDAGVASILDGCPIECLQLEDSPGVTDETAKRLAAHPSIRTIHFERVSVTDAGAGYLGGIASLRTVSLKQLPLTDDGMRSLAELPNLSCLGVSETMVTGLYLKRFLHAPLICYMDGCPLQDTFICDSLTHMDLLRWLSVKHTPLTDAAFSSISACRSLESIILVGTRVTNAIVADLLEMPELAVVDIRETSIDKEHVERLRTRHLNSHLPRIAVYA